MRTRAYRRAKARSKGKRLHDLDRQLYGYSLLCHPETARPNVRTDNWYAHNKIHCSCPMCSAKTRNKGRRRQKQANYLPSICRSHRDQVRWEAMNEDELYEVSGQGPFVRAIDKLFEEYEFFDWWFAGT